MHFESEEIMMKKLFALLMTLSLLLASGCASKEDPAPTDDGNSDAVVEETQTPDTQEENADAEGEENADAQNEADVGTQDEAADQSTITGTLGEVKDFMFEITDEQGASYALSFEGDKPEGLADVKTGDKVTVTYTGELSVVDPFVGTIVSVELAQ